MDGVIPVDIKKTFNKKYLIGMIECYLQQRELMIESGKIRLKQKVPHGSVLDTTLSKLLNDSVLMIELPGDV